MLRFVLADPLSTRDARCLAVHSTWTGGLQGPFCTPTRASLQIHIGYGERRRTSKRAQRGQISSCGRQYSDTVCEDVIERGTTPLTALELPESLQGRRLDRQLTSRMPHRACKRSPNCPVVDMRSILEVHAGRQVDLGRCHAYSHGKEEVH